METAQLLLNLCQRRGVTAQVRRLQGISEIDQVHVGIVEPRADKPLVQVHDPRFGRPIGHGFLRAAGIEKAAVLLDKRLAERQRSGVHGSVCVDCSHGFNSFGEIMKVSDLSSITPAGREEQWDRVVN